MAIDQTVSSSWKQPACRENWKNTTQKSLDSTGMSPQVTAPGRNALAISSEPVLLLNPAAQNYEWGRTGRDSEVAQLQEAAGHSVDQAMPYAELWMGTHPSGPSTIAEGPIAGEQLLAYIRDHPEALGDAASVFGADLPFLFKVLSVRTALSIQSHPDKELAERLYRERPDIYKDANHKPEMAVALSDFEALCGFCPHEEIAAALEDVPELRESCGDLISTAYLSISPEGRKDALKAVFTALMTSDEILVKDCLARMVHRLETVKTADALTPKERLVLLLNEQYPGDVGVFAAWFLNYVTLERGQAIALAANEPHAYLSGEIIECMATSDNVIRAGLTPKLRDTDALCDSLTYSQGRPDVLSGEVDKERFLAVYRPPFKEFEVWRFEPPAGATVELPKTKGPLLLLMQQGSGLLKFGGEGGASREVSRGQVLFVAAGTSLKMTVSSDIVAWIAAPNGMGF